LAAGEEIKMWWHFAQIDGVYPDEFIAEKFPENLWKSECGTKI